MIAGLDNNKIVLLYIALYIPILLDITYSMVSNDLLFGNYRDYFIMIYINNIKNINLKYKYINERNNDFLSINFYMIVNEKNYRSDTLLCNYKASITGSELSDDLISCLNSFSSSSFSFISSFSFSSPSFDETSWSLWYLLYT